MRTILAVLVLASAVAVGADGRVYVQSDPPGAEISLLVDGAGKDLGKTPSMVTVPQGDQVIILIKEGYKMKRVDLTVADSIAKTGIVALEAEAKKVDVIYGDDWLVLADGKSITDMDGKQAKTPCTISVPPGTKISVTKAGQAEVLLEEQGGVFTSDKKPVKGPPAKIAHVDLPSMASSEDEYKAIKGVEFIVAASKNAISPLKTGIRLPKGSKVIVVPNPKDVWEGGGSKNGSPCGYKGYGKDDWMKMMAQVGQQIVPVENGAFAVEADGELVIYAEDKVSADNKGGIKVKVVAQK